MHVTRLDIVLPVYLAKGNRDDRNITESEWSMSLRRVGLTANNCLLEFRPKEMGLWMWHPLEYYKNQYRELLVKTIGNRQVMLSELVEEVKRTRPPPIRTSTKVFLRCYPEVFWVTTHIASGLSEVRLTKTLEPPTFL